MQTKRTVAPGEGGQTTPVNLSGLGGVGLPFRPAGRQPSAIPHAAMRFVRRASVFGEWEWDLELLGNNGCVVVQCARGVVGFVEWLLSSPLPCPSAWPSYDESLFD